MKKKEINLLTNQRDFNRVEKFFRRFRRLILIYSLLFVLLILVLGLLIYRQNSQIQAFLEQKKNYLSILGENGGQEAKLIYIGKKLNSYEKFIRNDAEFLPYYNLLIGSLSTGQIPASLSSLTIEKSRNTTFSLSFDNSDSLLKSFDFLESDDFLKYFENLSISQFQAQAGEKNSGPPQLSFTGKFHQLTK